MRAVIVLEENASRERSPTIRPPRAHIALLTAAAFFGTTAFAAADQTYAVSGDDEYLVGANATVAHITYEGTEHLSVDRAGSKTRYTVQAVYTRNGDDGKANVQARFVQIETPRGSFEDEVDEDPDFLTVLNQPFAIQLDAATLHDLRALHGPVPFEATSPLGGDAVLRGFLRPATGGTVDGSKVVAVKFEAEGVMTGSLPSHSVAHMAGQMRMEGTAYYSASSALLMALDATLTIVAALQDVSSKVPVHIVYRRAIRANSSLKTPQPTPLPTGAGTESPAAR